MAEVTAKWDTYYVLPAGASYVGDTQVLGFWRDLLGQNVIELADLDAVCETIALTVGLGEDAIRLDDGLADLGDVGSAAGPAVSKALAVIGDRAGRAGTGRGPRRPGRPERERPSMSHVIVADLGYGDSGKGTVTDWLCSPLGSGSLLGDGPVRTVVRFNGGAQAGHNVVAADGRHHTFAQFGSGSFTPAVRTHLSRFVLVDPLALAAEADPPGLGGRPRRARPADRRPRRAAGHALPPGRQPGQGAGPGPGPARLLRHGHRRDRPVRARPPADAPRVADCDAPRRWPGCCAASATG